MQSVFKAQSLANFVRVTDKLVGCAVRRLQWISEYGIHSKDTFSRESFPRNMQKVSNLGIKLHIIKSHELKSIKSELL